MNLGPLLISCLMIGSAELGDKTQLLTLALSTRFPVWSVIGAISAATASLMALAVIFGGLVNQLIPKFYLQFAAGFLFIGFGLWTLLGQEKAEEAAANKANVNPFFFIFSTFFLAELGDKTQLATLTLSAQYGTPFQVWLGATLGMIMINTLVALSGTWIKRYLSDQHLKWVSGIIFLVFGLWTFWSLL